VRLPVVCSVIAHAALFLVALRLPAAGLTRADRTISVEIQQARPRVLEPKQEEPPQKPIVNEPPRPKPEPLKNTQRAAEAKPEKREQPVPPKADVPPPQPAAPPSTLSMRPSAPIDLNLHGLGGITLNNGKVSGGEGGAAGGTFGAAPRKEWKPRGSAGDPILGKLEEQKEERFPLELKDDGYHYDGPSFSAKIRMDGTVSFDEHAIRDFKGLSGGFDITDLAMRAKKQDPYRYEKEKFMELTAKLRGDLQSRARRDRLENSLAYLPQHLGEIWGDTSRSARERRTAIYYLWRDAAGTDDEVGQAGRKARSAIESFVRAQLPEGSQDAFTDEELRRFNARQSTVKFEPYRQP
jgi:hypothetical protein